MAFRRGDLRPRPPNKGRRYISAKEKQGKPLSPRRRAHLIMRYARMTRLLEHPERIAELSDASLALTLRIITHFIHEIPESRVPLLDRPSERVLRMFGRTPQEGRVINKLSRQTEEFAGKIFKNALLQSSHNPGHDLVLPLRDGKIEMDIKMVLNNSAHGFFPLATPFGKLKPNAADVFPVFALDGLFLVRNPDLKKLVEKHPEQFMTRGNGKTLASYVPVGDLARLRIAEKIPYREDVGPGRFGVPCPPHFVPFRRIRNVTPERIMALVNRMAAGE